MIVVGDKFKLKDKELLVTNLSGTGNIIFKILNDKCEGKLICLRILFL